MNNAPSRILVVGYGNSWRGDDGAGPAVIARLESAGLSTRQEQATVCCYAEQDKVWVNDPDGAPWEVYTVTDDNPDALQVIDAGCCTPAN